MNIAKQINQADVKFRFNCKPVKLTPVNIPLKVNNARKNVDPFYPNFINMLFI